MMVRTGTRSLTEVEITKREIVRELPMIKSGHFEGIITPMDVLEAIAGAFPEEATDEPKVVMRADGSYFTAGWMPVDEFADLLSLELDAGRDYETVADLVLEKFGHLPEVGQRLDLQEWTIEVVDLDGLRIDKLLVGRSG